MHKDLRPAAHSDRTLDVFRARIVGAAVVGIAGVLWWLVRLLGLWQNG